MEWNLSAYCTLCQLPSPYLTLGSFTIHPEHAEAARLCHISIYDDPKIYDKQREQIKAQLEKDAPGFETAESEVGELQALGSNIPDATLQLVERVEYTKQQLNTISGNTYDFVETVESQPLSNRSSSAKQPSPLNRSSIDKGTACNGSLNGTTSQSPRKRSN
jgi:hypothetical protein